MSGTRGSPYLDDSTFAAYGESGYLPSVSKDFAVSTQWDREPSRQSVWVPRGNAGSQLSRLFDLWLCRRALLRDAEEREEPISLPVYTAAFAFAFDEDAEPVWELQGSDLEAAAMTTVDESGVAVVVS